ncbi:MAG TPA: hypothetical protein VHY91_21735 [Pirellulales bacterium]|jgi:DNA-binding NarL/FixJ family response regulator|nr:hypothetical protein [Pirellulales bacterium]
MTRPALIVCEPIGLWSSALRQASAERPLPLVETRRPAEVWQQLAAAPASMVALAWSAERRAEMVEAADQLGRRFPQARWIALIDRRRPGDGPLARELGAIHVCQSPRQVDVVVRLARRHLGPRAAVRHWPAIDDRIEEIWQTLPWNFEEGLDVA